MNVHSRSQLMNAKVHKRSFTTQLMNNVRTFIHKHDFREEILHQSNVGRDACVPVGGGLPLAALHVRGGERCDAARRPHPSVGNTPALVHWPRHRATRGPENPRRRGGRRRMERAAASAPGVVA